MAKTPQKIETASEAEGEEELSPVARVKRAMPRQLPPHDIQPEGAKWGRWSVFSHVDHTIEDAMTPRYLYAKAEHIRPGDYIEIKHPLGDWVLCLDVVRVDREARGIAANVRHLFDYTREGAIRITPDVIGARIEFLGARQWAVVDGEHNVLADEFASRELAQAWLAKKRAA